MIEDAAHRVARLLPCEAQILLEGARHRGEDGLGRFGGVHRDGRAWEKIVCELAEIVC